EHDRDDRDHAGSGAHLDAAPDLRLGRLDDCGAHGPRCAGSHRDAVDGASRPHRPDELLRRCPRGELVPVREPLLVLRTSGGVHPRAARLRDRPRDPSGIRAQALVGLPPRGRGAARRVASLVPRLAAPPVRERHQRRPAAVLHALHRADLHSDRLHVPLRDDDDLARQHPLLGADAVLPRLVFQLLHRRPHRCLPLGCAERRDDARKLLLDGAFPLHDHGRPRVHVLRSHLLLGAEDDRPAARRAPRQDPLLDDVRRVQLDVRTAVRGRLPRPAAPRRHLFERPARHQRVGLDLRIRPRPVDARLPLQLRAVARVRACPCAHRSVGFEVDRVAAAVARAGAELRPHPDVHGRSLRLRRGDGPRRRPGRRAGRDGVMTELARHGTEYRILEEEDPDVLSRNLTAAGQLLASATAFFFLAFLFAYFYLRAVNNAGLWKPKHVDASIPWGTVVTACMVGSAVLVWLGYADHRADRRAAWRLKGAAALAVGLASLVLQVVAWTQQGFGPSDGGFASVYFGWTAFMFLFVL